MIFLTISWLMGNIFFFFFVLNSNWFVFGSFFFVLSFLVGELPCFQLIISSVLFILTFLLILFYSSFPFCCFFLALWYQFFWPASVRCPEVSITVNDAGSEIGRPISNSGRFCFLHFALVSLNEGMNASPVGCGLNCN